MQTCQHESYLVCNVFQDFNELKIYNDKAQQTIKDLKSCLEEARKERGQLVTEIKKLKDEGTTNKINSIVNHYMEKGVYEDAEKDHLAERSRSVTPIKFVRPRSPSPVYSRPTTPVRHTSPVKFFEPCYSVSTYTPEMSMSPTPSYGNYDDYGAELESDGHEIYPHRRTRSYVQKYGSQNDLSSSQVDLNDPEIQELLKPKPVTPKFKKDPIDNQFAEEKDGLRAKRKLMYSPYMDKDFVPKSQADFSEKRQIEGNSTTKLVYKPTSQRKSSLQEEWESKKFIQALDSCVKQTPAQIAQERFQKQIDMMGTEEPLVDRWRSPTKGILKNTKSAHNMSIKENITPRRSYESRSYSPSVRSSSGTPNKGPRSFTPDSRSYKSPSPLGRSYSTNVSPTRSYSPVTKKNRSSSPGNTGQRSHSPGNSYRGNSKQDSGYSTPSPTNNRIRSDNRDYSRTTTRHE